MRTAASSGPGRIMAAFGIAAAVLLAGGAGYRVLADRLGRSGAAGVIRSADLERLPMTIGAWHGRAEEIDRGVAAYTDADALLSRVYTRGGQRVTLYIAGGVRARDMLPHRPEVCYPSAGWTLQESRPRELALSDGSRLPCRMYSFVRGGLSDRSVAVLNYYILDGDYGQDVSALRAQVRRGSSGIRYVVQVQVGCSRDPSAAPEAAQEMLEQFGAEAGPLIRALMPDAAGEARP